MASNIAETFVATAKEQGDQIAVIEARTGKQVSFNELNGKADGYAEYLSSAGICAGDRTILMVRPSVDFICLSLALFKIGSPVVLIDPGMGYKNLLRCIARVAPKCLIGIPKALLFAKIFAKPFKTVEKSFCCGKSFGLLGQNILHIPGQEIDYPIYGPSKTDLAAIIFTTGSTGPPKGVCYEHSIFAAQLRLIKEYYGIGRGDVDQPAFPLFALFSTALGACAVIPDMDPSRPARVTPHKFVASLLKYRVTYSFGSPAIWNVVSRYCLAQGIVLQSLHKVLMAGAPVPGELLQRMQKILPAEAQVFTPYGATESLPIVSIEGREVVQETWQKSRQGLGTCVGRALPGIDIKIINIADAPLTTLTKDMLLPEDQIGEIIVSGEVVTRQYLHNPEETNRAKIADGDTLWHRMGDVGYMDCHQRLWFCGRRAHRVVTEGGTFFSVPCEAIINEHPDVSRSALVGIKDGNQGNGYSIPAIIVELKKDRKINAQKLLEELRQIGACSELTRDVQHFLIHKNFPVDIRHNAKIFREKLALWAQKKIFPRG